MISPNVLRWYLLIATAGTVCGWLFKPAPAAISSGKATAAWESPGYSQKRYEAGISGELTDMPWWKDEKVKSASSEKESNGKVPVRKVAWLFCGVIADSEKRFALIADNAKSPLKRYLPGDSLPGGEVLEVIDRQNIRFSLPGDEKGKDLERKLYAPAE